MSALDKAGTARMRKCEMVQKSLKRDVGDAVCGKDSRRDIDLILLY
jgi:hypothetical protein